MKILLKAVLAQVALRGLAETTCLPSATGASDRRELVNLLAGEHCGFQNGIPKFFGTLQDPSQSACDLWVSFFLARKFHRLWQILPKDIEVPLCFFRDLQQNGHFFLHLFNQGLSDGEANPIPLVFGEMLIMLRRSWWPVWFRLWSRREIPWSLRL